MMGEVTRGLADAGFPEIQPHHAVVTRPLWDFPTGLRSTELAAKAGITKQSIGAIVDQLEALEIVERVEDPEDKRAKLVRLTKRGREAARLSRALVRHVEADWARRIGAKRVSELRETLTALAVSLELEA
jgi:DNA-binding MarR family transcriptional regulator